MDAIDANKGEGSPTSREMWQTWEKVCAAGLCPPHVAEGLRTFGRARFLYYWKRYAARTGLARSGAGSDPQDAWHLLETYAQVHQNRAGKRYKDWLFARCPVQAPNWSHVMEAGASLLMRDVVREQLRREHAPAFMESLQAPLSVDDAGFSLEELLPGQMEWHSDLAERELDQLACQLAEATLNRLSEEEQLVIFARGNGIALTDPTLLRALKCSKSAAHRTHANCVARLCEHIRKTYSDEDPAWWVALAQRTLEGIHQQLFLQINREKGRLRFFINEKKKVEGQQATK